MDTYLIRSVTDTHVKVGQVGFDEIANDQLELFLLGPETVSCDLYELSNLCSLSEDTLLDFCGHPGVHLHGDDLPTGGEDSHCQVTCSRTDFKDNIRGLQIGFVDNTDTRLLSARSEL